MDGCRLWLDPWAPEYEGALGLLEDDMPAARVELDVEPGAWRALAPRSPRAGRLVFIDGVRRIEHRLHVESGGASFHGLLGSYAVGALEAAARARVLESRVRRVASVGGGLAVDALEVRAGRARLVFEPEPVPENTPVAPLQGLQNAMRRAEAALAGEVEADLVVLDGPLTYADRDAGPLTGLVKRLLQRYLPPERERLLPSLEVGERTPLFLIVAPSGRRPRYSCYFRVGRGRAIEPALAGLARLEIPGGTGLAEARRVADLATAQLPRFASDAIRDPRAPLNLHPVGGLESELRRRLGDALLVRRAIEARLMQDVA
jgi:hypothetical protein